MSRKWHHLGEFPTCMFFGFAFFKHLVLAQITKMKALNVKIYCTAEQLLYRQ